MKCLSILYYDYLSIVIDKITSLWYSCYPKASYTHRNRLKKDGEVSACIKCDEIFYLEKRTRRSVLYHTILTVFLQTTKSFNLYLS